jgi:hypothetical protein
VKSLVKKPVPAVLSANARVWTDAYVASGGGTRPWAHDDIKKVLIEETDQKCAYCEGKLLAVSFGDIEHIYPKSKFPERVVDWDNLTLACSRCNDHKKSKYDPTLEFVNPYTDRIEDHLLFLGAVVYSVSDRGFYTIKELKLNEPARFEARNRALESLEMLIRRWEEAPEGYMKENLAELIELQLDRGEYTASARTYKAARKTAKAAV